MNIDLTILKEKIEVCCKFEIKSQAYTFALAADFNVSAIINNGLPIPDVTVETVSMDFRPQMKKYTLKGLKEGTLKIYYSGKPKGNFAFLEERFIHFSFYNGWYPMDFDVRENYEVSIQAGDKYKILKASYDKTTRRWHYFAKQQALQDCNIICINTDSTYSLEAAETAIYWYDGEKEQLSKTIYAEYLKLCNFYRKLYGYDKIKHMDIVFVPGNMKNGAYMRDGLIVFSDVTGSDPDSLICALGHEIGHAYASGADTSTYDDWLNETGAEWSSYLYLLENKTEYFRGRICASLTEKSKEIGELRLKGSDNSRPDDVHLTGTLLYYEIYKTYGKNAIEEMLRIFDKLDIKNTDAFLNAVEHYNYNIAERIQQAVKGTGSLTLPSAIV